VKPTDLFFCENGRYQIGRWRIHDSHRHGWLSFAEVIQYSSNIGATKWRSASAPSATTATCGVRLRSRTGSSCRREPARAPGRAWRDRPRHAELRAGVSVTPLQMAAAFAAIANGAARAPFLVRRVLTPTATSCSRTSPPWCGAW